MKIPLAENYRIVSDSFQWMFQRKRTFRDSSGKKQFRWDTKGYYTTPERAFSSGFELMIREIDATSLNEAENAIGLLQTALDKQCTPPLRVTIFVDRDPAPHEKGGENGR